MPLVEKSTYFAPRLLREGHAATVYPSLSRRVEGVDYTRRRVELTDGDFLDVDQSKVGSRRAVVISHGLEGHSRRAYVLGMVRAFNRAGWDAAAWNFRGCSGEPNRQLAFTHSGASGDLGAVVEAVAGEGYDEVVLVGFSLGGNLTLKYLGELGNRVPAAVRAGVAFSVPCDLKGSAESMALPGNRIYMSRFLSDLRVRMEAKSQQFPGRLSMDGYREIRTFRDFDDRYTAPLHGYRDAEDYWARSSSLGYLGGLKVPALLINAADDPFLSAGCYPRDVALGSPWFHLEVPDHGGHVGFATFGGDGNYWSETRAVDFASRRMP